MADLLIPFVAGQKLTAALLNEAFDLTRVKYQSADSAGIVNTTFVSSTSLVLSVAANASYRFRCQLFCDTNATADMKYNLLLPSGATVRLSDVGGTTTSTSTQRTYSGVAAGTVVSSEFGGFIDISTLGGTLTLQTGQVVTSGTTILKVGSWIELTQVAF